jgi:hypothetical protein
MTWGTTFQVIAGGAGIVLADAIVSGGCTSRPGGAKYGCVTNFSRKLPGSASPDPSATSWP